MKILDRLPYFPEHRTLSVRGEAVQGRPYQIVVWVSVNIARLRDWDSEHLSFPPSWTLETTSTFRFSRASSFAGRGFRLVLRRGLALYPDVPGIVPPLPLLGLRALTENQLETLIDGQHREVSAHTPSWFANVLRMLRFPPY